MMKQTPIQEWYSGRSIFITGGTGFMGKVLVEKMLRDIPNLGNIFVMVRPKRGNTAEQRLEIIKKLPVFDRLKIVNPSALNKLIIVEGSLFEENLGLSESDKNRIINEVSVVFHMAASLRLEAGVKDAVIANTLGTKQVLDVCKEIKNIESVVHLSTAFCHCEIEVLDEKIYKPHRDPYEMIQLVQTESDKVLDERKEELIHPHPNSYTFSKRLAEWVAHDYSKDLPIAVARPSIVIPSLKEPTPGWVDSLNGPVGILVAAGKGVLRSMLCNKQFHAEVIPVDVAINILIATGYLRGRDRDTKTVVYNITTPRELLNITWGEVMNTGKRIMHEYPFEWMLWYPDGVIRTNIYVHWFILIFMQWIPAILLDILFFIIRRERFMIRVQKKIMVGLDVLQYFTLKEWNFDNNKSFTFYLNTMTDEDHEIFYSSRAYFNIETYMATAILGTRKYCCKESSKSLPYTRMHLKFLYVLNFVCKWSMYYLLLWYVLKIFGLTYLLTLDYWFVPEISLKRV